MKISAFIFIGVGLMKVSYNQRVNVQDGNLLVYHTIEKKDQQKDWLVGR